MPQIEVIHEEEVAAGWSFTAQVLDDTGLLRRHTVRLSWADYNLWSPGGADEPARVAEAVVAFMLNLNGAGCPDSFDASVARRLTSKADEVIPRMIRDGAL